jgi:hypothetical protein
MMDLLSMLELLVDETKEKGYVITGDVDFENVSKKASFITLFLEDDDSDVIKKIRCWQENENEIRKVNKHRAYSFE